MEGRGGIHRSLLSTLPAAGEASGSGFGDGWCEKGGGLGGGRLKRKALLVGFS